MREIRTSGLMSGEGKRGDAVWPKLPRLSSTLLVNLPWLRRYTALQLVAAKYGTRFIRVHLRQKSLHGTVVRMKSISN
jgi:hypothetical protein